MANDNVTPIDPNTMAQEDSPPRRLTAVETLVCRVGRQRSTIFQVMGVLRCAELAVTENDAALNEADIGMALSAAYSMLLDVCKQLDPAMLKARAAAARA